MIFHRMQIKLIFKREVVHSVILKVRVFGTRKWLIVKCTWVQRNSLEQSFLSKEVIGLNWMYFFLALCRWKIS